MSFIRYIIKLFDNEVVSEVLIWTIIAIGISGLVLIVLKMARLI